MAAGPSLTRSRLGREEQSIIEDICRLISELEGFVVSKCTFEGKLCLVVLHKKLYNHPPLGPTSRARIIIKENSYTVHVMMKEVESGSLTPECINDKISQLCQKYAVDSKSFKFCPGIDYVEYERIKGTIHFDLKSVHKTCEPFLRVDSIRCLLWYKLGKTCSDERRAADAVMCSQNHRIVSALSIAILHET